MSDGSFGFNDNDLKNDNSINIGNPKDELKSSNKKKKKKYYYYNINNKNNVNNKDENKSVIFNDDDFKSNGEKKNNLIPLENKKHEDNDSEFLKDNIMSVEQFEQDNLNGDDTDSFDEELKEKVEFIDNALNDEIKKIDNLDNKKVTLKDNIFNKTDSSEEPYYMDSYSFSDEKNDKNNKKLEDNVQDKEKEDWSQNNTGVGFGRVHFSYEFRVVCLVVGILLLFVIACFMIFGALKINSIKNLSFVDSTNTKYEVCYSNQKCYDSKLKYDAESIDKININFSYKAKFVEDAEYDATYRVVLFSRIYNGKEVVYEDKNVIIDNGKAIKKGNTYYYKTDVSVDFNKYNDFVLNYNNYTAKDDAMIDAVLYVDYGGKSREVSTVTVPLGISSFDLEVNNSDSKKRSISAVESEWTNTSTLIVVLGSLLIILSIVLLVRLTKLVLSTVSRKNKYEMLLTKLFNEYDKYLIVARGGYESEFVKTVVKVDSFDELLNVREILNKPIIYSKINNIKSEFIVEDEDLIYKFVLKESDIDN